MLNEVQLEKIARYLRHHAIVVHAEAEKMEAIVGRADDQLFEKASEIHHLADLVNIEISHLKIPA